MRLLIASPIYSICREVAALLNPNGWITQTHCLCCLKLLEGVINQNPFFYACLVFDLAFDDEQFIVKLRQPKFKGLEKIFLTSDGRENALRWPEDKLVLIHRVDQLVFAS